MKRFNTIEEAVSWVTARHNQNIGLDHFKEFIQNYSNELHQLKIIHVAGTNGKGSTCNFLCDCLIEAGYKTGMFTSPHLIAHQDRITINHQWISDEFFLEQCNQRADLWQKWQLNMFQIDFDIMIHYFFEEKVDYAIIETGLGGRSDSTNVIECPLASVIVSIGLDHMERLGDTKAKIASEKAGIIKPGCLVINGEKEEESRLVIEKEANLLNAELITVKNAEILSSNPLMMKLDNLTVTLSSLASYQVHNASCAITTLWALRQKKLLEITDLEISSGLLKSNWKGRFEVMQNHPLVIVDGAHNEHGVDALVQSMKNLPSPRIVVFAALKDKEFTGMIQKIRGQCESMIVTTFDFYRAAKLSHFEEGKDFEKEENWQKAIEKAIDLAEENGTVIITGSLYFISNVINWDRFHTKKA